MIKQGHVLDVLAGMLDNHFHCVVTSPPYWSLRKYAIPDVVWPDGWTGQLGLEPTIELYLTHIMAVFREVKRVLREDGTCWVNMGDSYSSQPGQRKTTDKVGKKQETNIGSNTMGSRCADGLKPKDLCLIPFRFVLAMQADGWWVRSDIIWAKANPMPESVTDRPTMAHEHIFLFTRSSRYFYDAEAVREKYAESTYLRLNQPTFHAQEGGPKDTKTGNRSCRKTLQNLHGRLMCPQLEDRPPSNAGRNLRSVWEINTQPYPEAHFATFPEELPRRCILAGTSARGCCPTCGKPWERVVEKGKLIPDNPQYKPRGQNRGDGFVKNAMVPAGETQGHPNHHYEKETLGWRPGCECGGDPVPCRVLDPFIGSGTTGKVAESLGRDWVGIDLGYKELSKKRRVVTRGLAL